MTRQGIYPGKAVPCGSFDTGIETQRTCRHSNLLYFIVLNRQDTANIQSSIFLAELSELSDDNLLKQANLNFRDF